MKSREYKWDREFLEESCRRINQEKQNLERQKSVVENLKSEIFANWQSFSSEIYLEALEVDVENLNIVIKAAGEMNNLLREVKDKAYGECEAHVRSRLSQVTNSMTRL